MGVVPVVAVPVLVVPVLVVPVLLLVVPVLLVPVLLAPVLVVPVLLVPVLAMVLPPVVPVVAGAGVASPLDAVPSALDDVVAGVVAAAPVVVSWPVVAAAGASWEVSGMACIRGKGGLAVPRSGAGSGGASGSAEGRGLGRAGRGPAVGAPAVAVPAVGGRGRATGAALVMALALASPSRAQPVHAAHAMVAAANPMAAAAGLQALRDGGTAIDAAIATQLVLAVVEPQASGLAGGGLMLAWDARTRALQGWDGLAAAPALVPARLDRGEDGGRIPARTLDHAGRAVGVPGIMPMLEAAHRRDGRLPWSRLVRDAVRLAGDGFAMPPYLHTVLARNPGLAGVAGFDAWFAADGQPLPAGTVLRNTALAATLARLGEAGPGTLRDGDAAAALLGAADAPPLPGRMTAADLRDYAVRERASACVTAFGHRICSAAPPSSGGIAVLQTLALLDRAGIAQTQPGSVAAAHLMLQAARLAAADRRRWIGDPDQVVVPAPGLLDPAYLDARAALIVPGAADADPQPGDPPGRQGAIPPEADAFALPATSHVAVIDADGNAVALTTTVNLDFGAWRLAGGMVVNDALTNFASPSAQGGVAANAMAPRKRPASTMSPTMVFDAQGTLVLVLGAGGGARIIDAVVQTALGVLAWGQDVRTAIGQPRIGAQNRAAELERGTAAAALEAPLAALGDRPVVVPMNAGVQAIARTDTGLQGWGDPRRDGVALGD